MDLPKALESVLCALLDNHSVVSWKVTAEGVNPTIVVRLRPVYTSDNNNGGPVNTFTYRRKTPSQVSRDQRRMKDFRQKLDVKNASKTDIECVNPILHNHGDCKQSNLSESKEGEGRPTQERKIKTINTRPTKRGQKSGKIKNG